MTSGIDQNSLMSKMLGAYDRQDVSKDKATTSRTADKTASQKKTENKKETTKNTFAGISEKYGNTIGKPSLSSTAASYYDSLKSKFSKDYEFVLVDNENADSAEELASKYAKSGKILVLIDEAQVEAMASNEDTRNKMEGIIADAKNAFSQMSAGLADQSEVTGFGIRIDKDGNASYFAVVDKSLAAQRERIEKKQADAKEAKKAEDKKEKKLAQEEALEARRAANGKAKAGKSEKTDNVTLEASSPEELAKKVTDFIQELRTSYAFTAEGSGVGQTINLSL